MVARLRAAIHAADPDIVETWKWVSAKLPGTPCFEHDGIVCHVNVLKERVRLTMSDGAHLPDPHHLFNAYPDSSRRRGIDWYEGDVFDDGGGRGHRSRRRGEAPGVADVASGNERDCCPGPRMLVARYPETLRRDVRWIGGG